VLLWVQATKGDGFIFSSATFSRLSHVADVYYYALLVAAAAGIVVVWREGRRLLAPSAFAAAVIGGWLIMHGWLFYGEARYRLPVMPFLMVFAAVAIDAAWRVAAAWEAGSGK
jgi:hypothetical protein